MDFKAVNIPKSTAVIVTDMIRTEMINMDKFIILERSQIDLILKETGFQQSGCTDETCAVKIGRMLSAKKLLIGTISKLGNKFVINGRLVDIERGISEFGENVISDSEDELAKAVKIFTLNLTSRIQGKIPDGHEDAYEDSYDIESSKEPVSIVTPESRDISNDHFYNSSDDLITDKKTGLNWQKKPSPERMTMREAHKYIASLNRKDGPGWRIPNKEELSTLLIGGAGRSCDALKRRGFIGIKCDYYWTETPGSSNLGELLCIDLGSDVEMPNSKNARNYVLAVYGEK